MLAATALIEMVAGPRYDNLGFGYCYAEDPWLAHTPCMVMAHTPCMVMPDVCGSVVNATRTP